MNSFALLQQQRNRAQVFIAEGTVKTHVKNLLDKLNVIGRTAAVREAAHRCLVRHN
jgi:ATP/maltotriose-dependent transcriptional regulator MalT